MSCRVARAREWSVRLTHERSYHEKAAFVSLTYDPEYLPPNASLDKPELQRFFKRLRKGLGSRKIKYYACGEYGENFDRPHYHAIIFGLSLSKKDNEILHKAWPYGFIKTGTVTYQSCRYVADYIGKSLDGTAGEKAYGSRPRPFQLMSKGLAKQWAKDNERYLKENLGCTINGNHVGLPRYYKRILEIDKEALVAKSIENEKRVAEHHSKRPVKKKFFKNSDLAEMAMAGKFEEVCNPAPEIVEEVDILQRVAEARRQADKNIKARTNLRKRKI